MGGEEHACAVEERDRRRSSLVLERFGVGEAGEFVFDGVEVGVADFLLVSALPRQCLLAAAALGPPAAAVGDLPDLLHVHVDHVPRIAGGDLPWSAQVFPVRSDVSDPVKAEPVQPAGHGPNSAVGVVPVGELAGDPSGRPLLHAPQVLDQLHPFRPQARRAVHRDAGAVLEPGRTASPVASDPLRDRGPGDVELRRDVRDQPVSLDHQSDGSLSTKHGPRGITVGHGMGLFLGDGRFQHHPSCRSETRSFIPTLVTTTS